MSTSPTGDKPWRGGASTQGNRHRALHVARMGLLFALAITFSFIESLVPSPVPVPGIKLGLSNIVVMYAVFAQSRRQALVLAVLKSLFALLVRGALSGALAFCGGALSVLVMLALLRIGGSRISYAAASMAGAVAHNVGQLLCAASLLQLDSIFWYYLPVLIGAGVAAGLLTAALLRSVMPLLEATKQ